MDARAKATILRFYNERLLRVLVEIQRRLDEPLWWEELVSPARLSPRHFHHVPGMLEESPGTRVAYDFMLPALLVRKRTAGKLDCAAGFAMGFSPSLENVRRLQVGNLTGGLGNR